MPTSISTEDVFFLNTFLAPMRICKDYTPAFGKGKSDGVSLEEFQLLYGEDPFYSWIGLNNDLVYAAHKAAGGLTSVYRQLGIGSERLFRAVIEKKLALTSDQTAWSYTYEKDNGESAVHTLDARISKADLTPEAAERLEEWITNVTANFSGFSKTPQALDGVVFEVRQGYKSADSKRQNADLRFGMRAYQDNMLPAFGLMSTQVSVPVVKRYRADNMIVLTGTTTNDASTSTFAFFDQVIGYNLADFFERNQATIQTEIREIISGLLTP